MARPSGTDSLTQLQDDAILRQIYQWTKQGLRMPQIALKLGYQPESFRGLLSHENGTKARQILNEAVFDAQDTLTRKLWEIAENDEHRGQLTAIKTLLERLGWGKDEADSEAERIQRERAASVPKTPDSIRARLTLVRDAQRAG